MNTRSNPLFIALFTLLSFLSSFQTHADCKPRNNSETEQQVMNAYIAYYGRLADAGGLAYWSALANANKDTNAIAEAFGSSKEFIDRYGNLDSPSLINNLYQQAFGREAEPSGLAWYSAELEAGRVSLPSIALAITGNALGQDIAILKHRREVSAHYILLAEAANLELSQPQLTKVLQEVGPSPRSRNDACALLDNLVAQTVKEKEDEFFAAEQCNNGSNGNIPSPLKGVIKGVAGLSYVSTSIESVNGIKKTITGITTAKGEFDYVDLCGQSSVTTFCLGVKKNCNTSEIASGIEIDTGSVGPGLLGRLIASPQESSIEQLIFETYPDVSDTIRDTIITNIYQLLFSLDSDTDPTNGISISEAAQEAGETFLAGIDFTAPDFDTNQSVLGYLIAATSRETLISEQEVKLFLESSKEDKYFVEVTADGLQSSVTILLNHKEALMLSGDGNYVFKTGLPLTENFDVSIITIEGNQTCSLSNATGGFQSGVNRVSLHCDSSPISTFRIGGVIEGAAEPISLSLNGLPEEVFSGTSFHFNTRLTDKTSFLVTIKQAPTNLECSLNNSTGIIDAADFLNVQVICHPILHSVGGTVSGASNPVSLTLNGGEELSLSNGAFEFNTQLSPGSTYEVALTATPEGQECVLQNASGLTGSQAITNITITCSDLPAETFSVGGNVSGAPSPVTIALNGEQSISVFGSFTFSKQLHAGDTYTVSVEEVPAGYECVAINGTGAVSATHPADITDIQIVCDLIQYRVGGSVQGARGGVTLILNNAENLQSNNGSFTFDTPITIGTGYQVDIADSPAGQNCTISNNSGTLGATSVSDVLINCQDIQYTVSGSITGASSPVTLSLNNSESLTATGAFTFLAGLVVGDTYEVTIENPGAEQDCQINSSTGTITNNNINNISVSCQKKTYVIGGFISGATAPVSLTLNGNVTEVFSGGSFQFSGTFVSGESYSISVGSNASQTCSIQNQNGMISGTNVTDVTVTCTANTFSIGGSISTDNAEPVTVMLNGGAQTFMPGSFQFSTTLTNGSSYNVTIGTPPVSQACSIQNGIGTVSGQNITNINVACSFSTP